MRLNKMSWIYGLLPASSLLFSMPYRCIPEPKTWYPSDKVRSAVWLLLAITTGLSGMELYKLNDQEASTIFIALVFFFGTGWIISTRVCNQWVNVAYIVLLTLTAWWLYKRLGDFKDTTQAKRSRMLLLPLLGWLLFSTALAGNALSAKLFKHKPTWRTM